MDKIKRKDGAVTWIFSTRTYCSCFRRF